jgi:hypothetical protein
MQILRRPETAQGRMGFWESGNSDRALTADEQVDAASRGIRGQSYFSALFQLLELFAEAKAEEDNEPVDVRIFSRARDLMDTLPHGFAIPEVGLDPDGEIALDWMREDRTMVSLSVGASGALSYAAILRDRTAHGIIEFGDGFPAALTELLRNLYHPA